MGTKEVRKKLARLSEIMVRDEDPTEAEQKEAVMLSIDLAGGAALNLARIAAALDRDPNS